MKTGLTKVDKLEVGDRVIRESDEEVLTISKITDKGFHQNSVFIDYREGGWTSIPKNATVQKLIK